MYGTVFHTVLASPVKRSVEGEHESVRESFLRSQLNNVGNKATSDVICAAMQYTWLRSVSITHSTALVAREISQGE